MRPRCATLLMGGLVGLACFAPFCARADEKGERILRESFRKLHEAQSMTAELTTERKMTGQPGMSGKGTITLKKPNRINVTLSRQAGSRTEKLTFVSDGKNYFTYTEGAKTYMRQPTPQSPTDFGGDWEGEIDAFFGGETNAEKVNADFAGMETLAGIPCDLIRVTAKREGDSRVFTYAIGQKDRLIYRSSWTAKVDEKVSLTQTNRLRNIKLNGPVPASLFAFVPPRDATLYDPQAALREMEAKLVAVGTEAPAFELTDPQTRSRISLAKMLEGRKAVLVNFWFYG